MFPVFLISIFTVMLSMIILSICSTISKKSNTDREKSSPFECGFDPKSSSRTPFSLRFFLIAIIFLVFDVEIALILPIVPTFYISSIMSWLSTTMFFVFILLVGLYHEWDQGMLEWSE